MQEQRQIWLNASAAFQPHPGGIGSHARGLGEALRARYAATLVSPPRLAREVERSEVLLLRPSLPQALWRELVLTWAVARRAPDIYVDPAFFAPLWVRNTTTCATFIHDSTPFNEWAPGRRSTLSLRHQVRRAFKRSRVIFTSQTVRMEYAALGYNVDNSPVIPLGVSTAFLECPVERPSGYMVYVGSSNPRKRSHIAREACQIAGIELLAIGPGISTPRPEREVIRVISQASAVVVPTAYEGFSLPVIEARALGVPVVCSDIGVHREFADGNATQFVMSDDPQEWARAISNVRSQPPQRRKSWTRTWDDVADELVKSL